MQATAVKKGTPNLTAPRRTATVQPKLMVNAPGDRYEQEADAMADQVMRMPQHQPTTPVRPATTGMIARSIQRKCAACEAGGKTCSSCAEEDKKKKLMRKAEGGGGGFAASPGLVSQLGATQGGGSPLSAGTRSFMENAFSADFSGVRVHTDGRAAEMSRGIQAKAFTYGSDIYFNGGEFAPESDGGKRLLAHELGHVVQQGEDGNYLCRQPSQDHTQAEDQATRDDRIIDELIILRESYVEDASNASGDDEEKSKNYRIVYLLETVISHYDIVPEYDLESYEVDESLLEIAVTETETIKYLIKYEGLEASIDNFCFDIYASDKVNAFPEAFLKILVPLLRPPFVEGRSIQANLPRARTNLDSIISYLPDHFFENGFPVGYERSLNLYRYELIKSQILNSISFKFTKQPPYWGSDFDFIIQPEEMQLHHGTLNSYDYNWTDYAKQLYYAKAYEQWLAHFVTVVTSIEHGNIDSINVRLLQKFSQEYPQGFPTMRDLVTYRGSDLRIFSLFFITKSDPYEFYEFVSFYARHQAAEETESFVRVQYTMLQRSITGSDQKIAKLSDIDRLLMAARWSVTKRFASQGIENIISNLDKMLLDFLEQRAKKSIFKRAVSFVASMHPIGRIAVLAYNVYETVDDVKDALDIVDLVDQVIQTIDEAKNADSVADMQRSSARLAKIYTEIIPLIAEKVSSGLARKLMQGHQDRKKSKQAAGITGNKKPDPPTRPVTKNDIIDDAIKTGEYSEEFNQYLSSEIIANKSKARPSKKTGYEVEIPIEGSNHFLARKPDGSWCLFSGKPSGCGRIQIEKSLDEVFEDLGRELNLDQGRPSRKRIDAGQSVADAQAAGLVDADGKPLVVDLVVQRHYDARDVRQAQGQSGQTHQSAHNLPTAVGKQRPDDYSRGMALTVILPTSVHTQFDRYWKEWSRTQRKDGVTKVTVDGYLKVMSEAIDQIPNLPKNARDALAGLIFSETYNLGFQPGDEIDIPNIK